MEASMTPFKLVLITVALAALGLYSAKIAYRFGSDLAQSHHR